MITRHNPRSDRNEPPIHIGITPKPAPQPYKIAAARGAHHMGEISYVVGAILYLESAGFVMGEILNVDGGQSAGH
jgi:hypothetical protein